MFEFDNMYNNSEQQNKIPYDQEPITRSARTGRIVTQEKAAPSKTLYYLVAFLMFVNVIMGFLLVRVYKIASEPDVVNNPTYNITAEDASNAVWASSTKAKLSAVCIGAGTNSTTGSTITYNNFFSTSSRGSGVIISIDKMTGEAYILTCYHVVEDYTSKIFILVYDSYIPVQATLVNASASYDLAVLKVNANSTLRTSSCQAATILDSSKVVEGQTAIAIGNPLSQGISVTCGVISSPVNLVMINGSKKRAIKIDTPINQGNSGGGLFNIEGNLIGIVNAKLMSSEIDNVAYAIPGNLAINLAKNIMRYGASNPRTASLGIDVKISANEGATTIDGVTGQIKNTIYVSNISTTGPCYNKLQINDIVKAIKYLPTWIDSATAQEENYVLVDVNNLYTIEDNLLNLDVGDTITITIERDGVILSPFVITITQDKVIS